MADYSTAISNAETALNSTTDGGFVKRYRIGNREVERHDPADQVKSTLLLEGIAARRASGLFTLAKLRNPRP